jgi:putative isomerase
MDINHYQIKLNYLLFCLFAVALTACSNPPSSNTDKQLLATDFQDVLNLKGIPDSSADRSVFAFSDLGAWHGYALPKSEYAALRGSFVGPYIMTQDNGTWLSQCLSMLEITDSRKGQIIDFDDSELIENSSYPNKLKQVLQMKELVLSTELIFVSNRTALIKVSIQNGDKNEELSLDIRWSGNSLLNEVSFLEDDEGVLIDFGKNENVGWISTYPEGVSGVDIENKTYRIEIQNTLLNAGDTRNIYLAQSFCFSEEERQKEAALLGSIFENPNQVYAENERRWNEHIQAVTTNLNKAFDMDAHRRIAVKCLQTLNTNWKSAAGFLKHDGLFPSYNYEWFNGFWAWDSWKHAVAIAKYDPKLAQNQIRAMYDFQDQYGMIADCVYRDTIIENHNWRDTKPPLSAWAIWEVYQRSNDRYFLVEMFPKLEQYHNWWYQYRDINQNGLCEYGSTDASLIAAKWESGMDNAVRFDSVKIIKNDLKGGSMNGECVDLNAYLCAEKKYMAKIVDVLGDKAKAEQLLSEADRLQKEIQQKFYNEESGWFFDYSLESNEHIKIYGAEGWIPLWTNLATPEQAESVKEIMLDTAKFATYIPFPILAADHPKFTPQNGYWRGPVWLDQAYFAIQGLKNYGYEEEAIRFSHQLFDRLEGLKGDLPIRENYHTLSGEGLESNHFSWSAAHLLMLLQD